MMLLFVAGDDGEDMLSIVSLTKPLLNKEGLANPIYEGNKHHAMYSITNAYN